MAAINQDPEVMRYFPAIQSLEATTKMIERLQQEYLQLGFTYFAVDNFEDGNFIGFIGLHVPTFEADFMPCVDIGWRLARQYWNRGFATEGAKRCLQYGFDTLGLMSVVAIAPKVNLPSIHVMQKVGMKKELEFKHPLLLEYPYLVDCELYKIRKRHARR